MLKGCNTTHTPYAKLTAANLISSAKEMNPITRKCMGFCGMPGLLGSRTRVPLLLVLGHMLSPLVEIILHKCFLISLSDIIYVSLFVIVL